MSKEKMGREEMAEEYIKVFNALPIEKQKRIVYEEDERRFKQEVLEKNIPNFIEKQTNAEIMEMQEFKDFCAENGIKPTKRQASKYKQEFIEWYKKQKEEREK